MVKLGEIARIIESGKKKEPPKPKSLGAAAPGEIDKDKAKFLAPFSFPMEVTKEYMEKSKDPEKARKKVENLEKIINKELSELRKKGKDIISDGYAYDYLESNQNSPLADILCDYWEKQKADRTEEKKGTEAAADIEDKKEPVALQPIPVNKAVENKAIPEKETLPVDTVDTNEAKKAGRSETEIPIVNVSGDGKKPAENIPVKTSRQRETEEMKLNSDIKKIGRIIERQFNERENSFEKFEVGTIYNNPEGGLIRIIGIFPEDYIVSVDIQEKKRRINKEFTFIDFRSYLEENRYAREMQDKTDVKKIKETKTVGGKEKSQEKKRVIKEITEEKLEEQLRNVKTKEELLDILNSYESFQFNPSEKKKGEYYWLINSPHFDELRKYLKGEINKLDDGYWRDIPLVIRNKVKDMFVAEKKQRDSEEKIESGKEKSAEEQLFEQDMKTLKDIALRMTLELDSRLKEEDAEYKNKNEKDRNAFLQGALRSFLQKVMKRYELPPEESKGKISQIIEGIINS